jgi:hypothetical protein
MISVSVSRRLAIVLIGVLPLALAPVGRCATCPTEPPATPACHGTGDHDGSRDGRRSAEPSPSRCCCDSPQLCRLSPTCGVSAAAASPGVGDLAAAPALALPAMATRRPSRPRSRGSPATAGRPAYLLTHALLL